MPNSAQPHAADSGRFQKDIVRMLMTLFTVIAIDVVVVSLIQRHLRFWFPVWLDPQWATREHPWVVYSQSYFTGIFMIPVLLRSVDRDFLSQRGTGVRAALWIGGLGIFGFILWWKGNLMIQHGKHLEAVAWLGLTLVVWTMITLAEVLPRKVAALRPAAMLGWLLTVLSGFFLVMAALDPLVQLRVQHLGWSSGLIIEVGFFIPAGIASLIMGRRLRRQHAAQGDTANESVDVRIRPAAAGSGQGAGLA